MYSVQISSPRSIANHPSRHGCCPRTNKPGAGAINIAVPSSLTSTSTSTSTSRAIRAVDDGISAITSDPAQAELTWQIVVGTLAGVAPFVVAGIEFSKRIVQQRNCKVCKGSGLVLRDNKYYFRCPRCGGFLPWQSWRRFFTG